MKNSNAQKWFGSIWKLGKGLSYLQWGDVSSLLETWWLSHLGFKKIPQTFFTTLSAAGLFPHETGCCLLNRASKSMIKHANFTYLLCDSARKESMLKGLPVKKYFTAVLMFWILTSSPTYNRCLLKFLLGWIIMVLFISNRLWMK